MSKSLAMYSLLFALLLTIAGYAHIVAFSLQQPSIQPVQQGIPGLGIPEQGQGQQQQQQANYVGI